eukprot:9127017-Karenia_brevis.AAC.1
MPAWFAAQTEKDEVATLEMKRITIKIPLGPCSAVMKMAWGENTVPSELQVSVPCLEALQSLTDILKAEASDVVELKYSSTDWSTKAEGKPRRAKAKAKRSARVRIEADTVPDDIMQLIGHDAAMKDAELKRKYDESMANTGTDPETDEPLKKASKKEIKTHPCGHVLV